MKQYLLRLFVALMCLAPLGNLSAQVTSSGVNGTITDASTRETLIGASVVAKHIPTGTVYGAATNAKGNFSIQGMRPGGPYTIEISYIGYQTIVMNNVTLSLGETETINAKLKDDSKALEQVVVTGKKNYSLTATRTGAASSFSRTAIDRTPSVSRSIFDIAKLTPQAAATGSGASFAGSSNKYNSFQIDGAVNNDVFGLSGAGTNGADAGTTPISLEAIEAVQVVIAPFDVRQGGFTGGGINAITKSGSNTWKGSAYTFYNNQDFYGTTPGADIQNRKKLADKYEATVGLTLGGPIVKDKLFFFANGEYVDGSSPALNTLGDGSNISEASVNQVLNRLNQLKPGYTAGGAGAVQIPTTSYKALGRLDWNINQAHRLTLRYSYVKGRRLDYRTDKNNLNFLSRGFYRNSTTQSVVAELNSRMSSAVNNEFRAGYTRIRDFREGTADPFPSVRIKLKNSQSIYFGGDPFSVANQLDQDIFTLTDNVIWNLGNHSLTFGTHNELFNIYNLFIPNNHGSYVYTTLEDFVNGNAPEEFDYSYSNESVTGTRRWGPRFKAAQLGFYVQDEWKLTDLFRLTYGLRADLPLFIEKPTANDYFNSSAIAKKYGVQNNMMPKLRVLWSPRIGFRYNLDEDRKDLIRGGVGIFTGRVPFVWISNAFGNTGADINQTRLFEKDFASHPDFAFQVDPDKQYIDPKAKRPRAMVAMVSEDFRYPQVLRANLAFETILPGDIKASLEGMFTQNLNNIRYRNLMVEKNGKFLDHGGVQRPLHSAVEKDDTNPYTYLILMENTNKGYTYNLTASLSKSFDFGLDASIAYTYGSAMSVHDGGSSQAHSAWRYNYIFDGPNEDEMFHSQFDMRHRIVGNLSYRVEYGKHFATTIGLVYNGYSGPRFNMIYNGDINGDRQSGNDLLYVPTTEEIGKMNFGKDPAKADAARKSFDQFIASNDQLSKFRGNYVPRNGMMMPFVNQFDLHFAQDFFVKVGGRRHTLQLNADIVNLGNMLNRGWGLSHFISNYNVPLVGYKNGEYSFTTPKDLWTVSDIDSRWRAQVGVKYIF